MYVTPAVQQQVTAKLNQVREIATKKYGVILPMPLVTYDLRGRTAGTANYINWHIKLNAVLLMENVTDFLARTVPHEMAHLITDKVYPKAHRPGFGKKRSPHGTAWQSVMRVLGCDPSRCHSYDTKNARVKNRSPHEYKCAKCGASLMVSEKKHLEIMTTPGKLWHAGCKGAALVYVKTNRAKPAAPMMKPIKSVTPKLGSKLEQCLTIYETSRACSRDQLITAFIRNTGMSKAGATTYYYQCKKLVDG